MCRLKLKQRSSRKMEEQELLDPRRTRESISAAEKCEESILWPRTLPLRTYRISTGFAALFCLSLS